MKVDKRYSRHVLIGSIILVFILVFILAVVCLFVFMVGNTQHTTDRAWMTVQEATIVGPLVQHNIPTATIRFKNTGHSPALRTKFRLVMTVWTSNKLPDWEMPLKLSADAQHTNEIGPSAVVSETIALIAPLTDEQGIHLERKDWFVVILGIVAYVDVFGSPHETHLCRIWQDTSTQHLTPCEKWNETD
ncbi:MAG: hypothetical protein QM706_05100 [Nitrospira sp.]